MNSQRLFILDPSLKDRRGHHFSLTRRVSEAAQGLGIDVVWGANSEAPDGLADGIATLCRAFDADMYAAYKKSPPKKGGVFSRLAARFAGSKPAATKTSNFGAYQFAFRQGLERLGEQFEWTTADHVLVHTADGATYLALAEYWRSLPQTGRPTLHICTPYDPVGVMPNRHSADEVAQAVADLRDGSPGTHFYGENARLAAHLEKIWATPVAPLELPLPSVAKDAPERATVLRQTLPDPSAKIVLCLGAARLEKGFHLLPDIVSRTLEFEESENCPPVHFVLQATPQIIGYHPVVSTAIEKLKALPAGRLTLLTDQLSDEDYEGWLGAADLVLMPYDEKAYKYRGSGIVTEAVAHANPIIATAGSYPGQIAELNGGGTGDTPKQMAASIVAALKDLPGRTEKSREYLQRMAVSANPVAYVRNLLSKASLPGSD